jgi:tetratricopeptide (TPR) repeat protein
VTEDFADDSRVSQIGQRADVVGRDNTVVQVQGDRNTVVIGFPHLVLTRYLARRTPATELELLHPYSLALPLVGRDSVMQELWSWLRSDAPISVRLLVARGGVGKTRLALQLCEEAVREGWHTGFITRAELERFRAQQNLSMWGWQRPTLAIIDYSAAKLSLLRPWLTELAANLGEKSPLRLLLLERHAEAQSGWWYELAGRGDADSDAIRRLFDPADPVRLPRLIDAAHRRAVFVGMLERLDRADVAPSEHDSAFSNRLAEVSWGGEPLFLMMAALTAAKFGVGPSLALGRVDASFKIADIELARISQFASTGDGRRRFLQHVIACATLCQGLSADVALTRIEVEKESLGRATVGDAADLFEEARSALPSDDGGIGVVLPDVVGEALMLRALGEGNRTRALECIQRLAEQHWERVAASVIRTLQDYGEDSTAPAEWLNVLARVGGNDAPLLQTLVDQLPDNTLILRETAAELTQRLTRLLRVAASEGVPSKRHELALALNSLSNRLGDLGQAEQALKTIEEAIGIWRSLTESWSARVRSSLAMALINLSARLNALGRHEQARETDEEAIDLYRSLVSESSTYRWGLAASLNNHCFTLRELRRHQEALSAIAEAIFIRRELVAAQPDAFKPSLAMALNNLSSLLDDAGRSEDALSPSEEAVAIYRELVASRPDSHRPDLAMALHNMSNHLGKLRRATEALAASQEAVAIRQGLAADRPDAFRADLAISLVNHTNRLRAVGNLVEAVATGVEAVAICRELVAARPDAVRHFLAAALVNLSSMLPLSRQTGGLEAAQEAVEIYRALEKARPAAFRAELSGALSNLSNHLSDTGQNKEALSAGAEAVVTLRPQFLLQPRTFGRPMQRVVANYVRVARAEGVAPNSLVLDSQLLNALKEFTDDSG